MTFEIKVRELSALYLADAHAPDITAFVDQLFHVATETGAVACVSDDEKNLRFFVPSEPMYVRALAPNPAQLQATCIVEHGGARPILRMICARLGAICKEQTGTDISPYSDKAEIEYAYQDHRRWSVSYTNTPIRQEFVIRAL